MQNQTWPLPANFERYRAELAQEKAARAEKTALYVIRGQITGLIKIGIAMKPRARLTGLQLACPDKLELMGVIRAPGAAALEKHLHQRFAEHRSHGEWFRPAAELLAYIAERAQ